MVYVSEPSDATKNVPQPINYEVKRKQSEFERQAQRISRFRCFLLKIRELHRKKIVLKKIE